MASSKKLVASVLVFFLTAAMAFAQNLSVNYDAAKLSSVIADIHNKTGCNFVYNNTLIDVGIPVTAKAEGSLRQVLDKIFSDLPIEYGIMDNQITLSPSKQASKAKNTVNVSGTVTDDTGAPLPGVFVSEKGANNATISDGQGRYNLTTAPGATLLFSCIGLKDFEQSVPRNGGKMDIAMNSDINYLDEVVVVGYGVQKRANLTGAVSSINFSEGMASRPITSTSAALGGLAPGLAVTQTSGQPGEDGATLRVRGNTTLNTNSPLVLVDGIEYSMDNINPQDIESITVLKDASSTAIYGSRAANGVILVTTKSGKSGQAHVTYTCNMNLQRPELGCLEYVTDYATFMNLANEGCDNLGISHQYSDQTIALWENAKKDPDGLNAYGVKNSIAYPNTDWFKEVFQTGFMQTHNVAVSGGTEKTKSYISLGYMDNAGVMSHHGMDSGSRKFDIRSNVEMNVNDWLTAGVRLSGERQDYGMMDLSSGMGYLKMTVPGMYPGGPNKWGDIACDEENPNAANIFGRFASRDGEKYYYRFSGSAYLKAQLFKGLTAEFTYNHSVSKMYEHMYAASANTWNYVTDQMKQESSLSSAWNRISISDSYKNSSEALLRYNNTFGKHEVGALAGFSTITFRSPWSNVERKGKTDWYITEFSAYTEYSSSDSGNSDWGLMSFFGRANYAYDSKYLFEANLRYDGSSRFAPESRWGLFPSFSAGWAISREPWMKWSSGWLDNLKIRASWGVAGNNNSGNYAWQSTYNTVSVVSGGADVNGLIVSSLGNNALVWETTKTSDVGLDFSLWGNRLTGEIDGYIRNTSGILYRPSIYMTMGSVTGPYENMAGVQNKGLELGLKWKDGIGKDFSYSVGLNLAYNITTVTKYKGKLIKEWRTDEDGNKYYYNNFGDVAQSGFGGYIVEGQRLGDQYIYNLYRGSGEGYSGSGEVDINAGPKDGMIRTDADLQWVTEMIKAGYKFQGGTSVGKQILYYGDFIYEDSNGDGDYGNTDDRNFTGETYTPKVTAGLNLNLRWKGFDLYALFTGAFGFYLNWNASIYNTGNVGAGHSIVKRLADDHYFYDPSGDPALNNIDGTYPRFLYNKDMNDDLSDFYHYKGDYVKLKSIQFGYTLPKRWVEKIRLDNLRLFVSGENLLTLTSYPGLDPEIGTAVGYPLMKTYSGGLQVTF